MWWKKFLQLIRNTKLFYFMIGGDETYMNLLILRIKINFSTKIINSCWKLLFYIPKLMQQAGFISIYLNSFYHDILVKYSLYILCALSATISFKDLAFMIDNLMHFICVNIPDSLCLVNFNAFLHNTLPTR